MARLPGPASEERTFFYTSGAREGRMMPAGIRVPLYADEACTQAADVRALDGNTLPTDGGIPYVAIGASLQAAEFLFPDVPDPEVYTRVLSGPVIALHPRSDSHLDAFRTRVTTAEATVAAAAATASGMAAAVAARVSKGELAVNVRDYGATGDGATDDTAAINAALAAAQPGARVLFPQPAAHYRITDALQVRTPGLLIEGAARGVEIRQYTWCRPAFDVLDADGVTVQSLTLRYVGADRTMPVLSIRGGSAYTFSAGVWSNSNRTTVRDCHLIRFVCGVYFSPWSTATSTFTNGHVGNSASGLEIEGYDFGILFVGQDGLRLIDCYAHDDLDASGGTNATHAVYGSDNGNTLISNNVLIANWTVERNNFGQAYQARGTRGLVATNLVSADCQGLGNFQDVQDARISNLVGRNCVGGQIAGGGLTFQSSTVGNKRVTVSGVTVFMSYEGRAVFATGSDFTLRDVYIESKRDGSLSGDFDMVLRGTRLTVDGVQIRGVGSVPAAGIGLGHGETVSDVNVSNVSGTNIANLVSTYGGSTDVQVSLVKEHSRGLTGSYTVGPANLASETDPDVQTFTTSGVWKKPANAKVVHVRVIGGGGGAGSGRRGAAGTARSGGGGGGGGGVVDAWIPASALPATAVASVGAAGVGGAAVTTDDTNGTNGTAGTASNLAGVVAAYGGFAGGGGTTTTGPGGGTTAQSVGSPGGAGNVGVGANAVHTTGAPGGPGGGGVSAANAASNGGGFTYHSPSHPAGGVNQSGGVVGGATPADGGSVPAGLALAGGSAGGGAASVTGDAQAGGNGGRYGAGGAGGGASLNGNLSGRGGDGAPGLVQVITYR